MMNQYPYDDQRFSPKQLRATILDMAFRGGSVHVGCAFSLVEIVTALYSRHLRFNASDPFDPSRDRMVLSKGHGVMAFYAAFKELGWLKASALENYFADGSELFGLSEWRVPGLDASGGSLGHGLPVAAGIAFALKCQQTPQRVFCIVGDGEINEGSIWEGILFAKHHGLNNLITIVDANGFQAMGNTREIANIEPMAGAFEGFGCEVRECDGHDLHAIDQAIQRILASDSKRPKVLIARTVKGKGVGFMESNNEWHYRRLTPELFEAAKKAVEGGK